MDNLQTLDVKPYDPYSDVIEIEGIKYSGCLFREFGMKELVGQILIIERKEDGVITIKLLPLIQGQYDKSR